MGLFSGLFGGGKTTINQQAANSTDVTVNTEVQNEIVIDTEKLADAIKQLGELSNSGQVLLATGLVQAAQVQAEQDKAQGAEFLGFLEKAWEQLSRLALWIAIAAGVWFFWLKGSK